MKKLQLIIAILLSCACVGAFAQDQDAIIGSGLVVVQGTTTTIYTSLSCNQGTYQVPVYETDYSNLWGLLDNGELQSAYDYMRYSASRVDDPAGMVNDFRRFLAIQPGLPNNPAYYMQGKAEDWVGNPDQGPGPNQSPSPAWCLQNYGLPFINSEFGIASAPKITIKRYPRWETTGGAGLDVVFSNGKIEISAPTWDPMWVYYPHPDSGDLLQSEEIYYVPYKGARPTLRFAVTVVGNRYYAAGAKSLPLTSSNLGYGYAVPLLEGSGTLLIQTQLPIASNKVKMSLRRDTSPTNTPPTSGPIQVPLYLRVVPGPGFEPTFEGQRFDTQSPTDGSMVLSRNFPKLVKTGVLALKANTIIQIDSKGNSQKTTTNADGSVSVEAPIKNIPVKAEIDAEIGIVSSNNNQNYSAYWADGPVYYDERKWQYHRVVYHWVAVKSSGGGFTWFLESYQIFQRIGLQREYNQHHWDGDDNEQQYPIVATIDGWRSKAWVWVGWTISHPFTKGHWEWRSVRWPSGQDGEFRMIHWLGDITPVNPCGDIGRDPMKTPIPVYRKR